MGRQDRSLLGREDLANQDFMSEPTATHNRHIVISGGSKGLGRAIVVSLLSAGYRVSTFSRTPTQFTEQLSTDPHFFFATADLADKASLSAFLKSAEAKFG